MRVAKEPSDPAGKGSFWAIDPKHLSEFQNGIFIGKIRGAEYRSMPKLKNRRRSSAPYSVDGVPIRRQDSQASLTDESVTSVDHNLPSAYLLSDPSGGANAYGYNGPAPVNFHSYGYGVSSTSGGAPTYGNSTGNAYATYGYSTDGYTDASGYPVDPSAATGGYSLTTDGSSGVNATGSHYYYGYPSGNPESTSPWQSVAAVTMGADASSLAQHRGSTELYSFTYGSSEAEALHASNSATGPLTETTHQPASYYYSSNVHVGEGEELELAKYQEDQQQQLQLSKVPEVEKSE